MATNPDWLVQMIDLASLEFAFDGPSYTELTEGILGPDANAPDGIDEDFNSSVELVNAFQQEFDGSTFDLADMNSAAPQADETQIEAIQASAEANEQISEQIISDLTGTIPTDPTPVALPVVPIPTTGGGGPGGGLPITNPIGGDPGDIQCPLGYEAITDTRTGEDVCVPEGFLV
jgi:hypothetical protein